MNRLLKPNIKSFSLPVFCLLLSCLSFHFSGCRQNPQATTTKEGRILHKIIMQTDWYAQPEHGGFYNALIKGFYEENGLDVEIRQGGPASVGTERVATGKVHFSLSSTDQIMIFVDQGLPLIVVYAYMQRSPQAVLLHEDSPVNTWKDLDGKNIMVAPGASWTYLLQKKYDIQFGIIPLDMGMGRFLTDKDFIQQCFVTNEPYFIAKKGVKAKTMLIADSGFNPYRVVFTDQQFAREYPELVSAFVAASMRGWLDYVENVPAETNAELLRLNPANTPEFVEYAIGAMRDYQLVSGNPELGEFHARVSPLRMQRNMRDMVEIGVLEKPLPMASYLSNEFLPPETQKAIARAEAE